MSSSGSIDQDERAPPSSTQALTKERRKLRRKKRKVTLTETGSQPSATREQSVIEGEIAVKNCKKALSNSQEIASLRQGFSHQEQHVQEHSRRSSPNSRHPDSVVGNGVKDVFFIDVQPAPLLPTETFKSSSVTDSNPQLPLLLPAHVSIFGNEPVEILPPAVSDSDEEYIDYLDLDDRKGDITRYFEDRTEQLAKNPNRTICKNCGAEGEHKTVSCPVIICLTCGSRNEHVTRSCPISKTCFTCGMKGHINATCPNRNATGSSTFDRDDVCERCGSSLHRANECPTSWRLYEYVTEEEKDNTLRLRRDRQHLVLGQGGEAYIADDEWCYNCGHSGHWGDDCQEVLHQGNIPDEPSAFSAHNTLSGPFSDGRRPSNLRHREPRDWERENGWSNRVPELVGRQGRRNHIARMERRAQELVEEHDTDDWFDDPGSRRNRTTIRGTENQGPAKLKFGKSLRENGRQHPRPSDPPSLLERLSDDYHHGLHERRPDLQRSRQHSRLSDRYRQEPDRDRDRSRRPHQPGPRYKGGYAR